MPGPDERPNPWVSTGGQVAHPDSPGGSGGFGHFRIPGSLDGPGKQSFTVPQPSTQQGRNHVLSADDIVALDESKTPPSKKNPPPKTTPQTFQRTIPKNAQNVEVKLTIKILDDIKERADVTGGNGETSPVQGTLTAGFVWAEIEFNEETGKVTKVDGVNKLEGLIELQIRYAVGVSTYYLTTRIKSA